MLKIITTKIFDKIDCIKYAFFTRLGGFSTGDFESLNFNSRTENGEPKENVIKNIELVKKEFNTSNNIFKPKQVHGNKVFILNNINSLQESDIIEADATVTKLKNIIIGINTADCVPILLVDDNNKIIAAIHAGWKSAVLGIIQNTVKEMVLLGADVKNIKASIGPHLRVENFEIKQDFIDILKDNKINYEKFIKLHENKIFFNISKFVYEKLIELGINTIEDVNLDTYSNTNLFFSFRKSFQQGKTRYGCQLSGIMLK